MIAGEGRLDLGAGLGDGRDPLQAGIVDEDVDMIQHRQRVLDGGAIGDVAAERPHHTPVFLGELGGCGFDPGIVGEDREIGPRRRRRLPRSHGQCPGWRR